MCVVPSGNVKAPADSLRHQTPDPLTAAVRIETSCVFSAKYHTVIIVEYAGSAGRASRRATRRGPAEDCRTAADMEPATGPSCPQR